MTDPHFTVHLVGRAGGNLASGHAGLHLEIRRVGDRVRLGDKFNYVELTIGAWRRLCAMRDRVIDMPSREERI